MTDRLALTAALLTTAVVGVPGPAFAGDAASARTADAASGRAASAVSARADFRIDDDRITESSGLARSVRHPHTVWTVNDSGDRARVFAIDTVTGTTVGVHTFDAEVRDVEALAITPQGRVLVADIGDNAGTRDLVRVFWFDEPRLGKTSGAWASWELSYPDGPHDAESLAVDPTSGRVFVVTKERPGGIYALPLATSRKGVNRMTRVGTAPDIATDAVFLPGGSGLAVRTYTSLVVLDPKTWRVRSSQLLPLQPQGETLAVDPDGSDLLVGSEGKRSLVRRVTVTNPTASPSTSSNPSAAPGEQPSGSSSPTTTTAVAASPGESGRSATEDADASALAVNRGELLAGLGACAGLVALAFLLARLGRRGRR